MNRRDLIRMSAAMGWTAAFSQAGKAAAAQPGAAAPEPLHPPAEGSIRVAFLLSEGAQVIDFAGPWEVFFDVGVPGRAGRAFSLYTVAEHAAPIRVSGGMMVVPNYTFATAPAPQVIVIPAQDGANEAAIAWIKAAAPGADLTMSVCTGAFVLARTGLLDGKAATTYHGAFADFVMAFPRVALKRGARFVEAGNIASAGGLSSGIDLALRVVERYFGRAVAQRTAYNLEYQGQGWLDPQSNLAYAKRPVSTELHPLCAVCDMAVDKATAPASTYRGRPYYFCMPEHQALFDAGPDRFLAG